MMTKKLWEFYLKFEGLIWATLFFCVFMITWMLKGNAYEDGDGYYRLLRIVDFIYHGQWQETLFKYSNYPYGEVNHWTRPMDVFWILVSLPFFFVHSMSLALYMGGFFVSPVLLFLTVCVLLWGTRPFLTPFMRVAVLFLFLSFPYVENIFEATRPDHHSMTVFLTAVIAACFFRWMVESKKGFLLVAGSVCALAVWVAPEAIFVFYAFLAFLFAAWIFYSKDVRSLSFFSGSFMVGIILAWLANPPMQGLFYSDNGRISFFWAVLAVFTWLSVLILQGLSRVVKEADTRCFLSLLVAGLAFTGFYLLMGEGSFRFAISPYIHSIWGRRISEMRSPLKSIWLFLSAMPPIGIAFCAGIYLFFKTKSLLVLLPLIPLTLFVFVSLDVVRFVYYADLFAVLVWGFFVQMFLLKAKAEGEKKIPDKVMGLLFIFFLSPFAGDVIRAVPAFFTEEKEPEISSQINLAYLETKDLEKSVLADTFWGAELAWKTLRPVIGTAYHRNVEGIRDGYRLFFSDNEREIVYFIRKHRVGDIVMRGDYIKEPYPFYEEPEKNLDKLYAKVILNKELYPWMIPVLTDVRTAGYYLYRIDESKLPPLDAEENAALEARKADISLPDKIPEVELTLFEKPVPIPKTTFTKEDIVQPSPFDVPKKSKFMRQLEEMVPAF